MGEVAGAAPSAGGAIRTSHPRPGSTRTASPAANLRSGWNPSIAGAYAATGPEAPFRTTSTGSRAHEASAVTVPPGPSHVVARTSSRPVRTGGEPVAHQPVISASGSRSRSKARHKGRTSVIGARAVIPKTSPRQGLPPPSSISPIRPKGMPEISTSQYAGSRGPGGPVRAVSWPSRAPVVVEELAQPEPVDVRQQLRVQIRAGGEPVRLAELVAGVQIDQRRCLAGGGQDLADPLHGRPVVRHVVEVEPVDADDPAQPLDPAHIGVVPPRVAGRDDRDVPHVGRHPPGHVVSAQMLLQPRVPAPGAGREDLVAQRREDRQLRCVARQFAHRVVHLDLDPEPVRLLGVGAQGVRAQQRVVDVRIGWRGVVQIGDVGAVLGDLRRVTRTRGSSARRAAAPGRAA